MKRIAITNKHIRNLIKENNYKQRLKKYGIKGNDYTLKTTGKPCSCAMCSPNKVEEKAKYRLNKFDKNKLLNH